MPERECPKRGSPREMTFEAYKAAEVEGTLSGDTVLLPRQRDGRRLCRFPATVRAL